MKKLVFIIVITVITGVSSYAQSQVKTETFKVKGNCGMCKKTIEGSVKRKKGVESGAWNTETKMFTVSYDPAVTSMKEIKQAVADKGYDTDEIKATDKAYNSLHGCCQYDREK